MSKMGGGGGRHTNCSQRYGVTSDVTIINGSSDKSFVARVRLPRESLNKIARVRNITNNKVRGTNLLTDSQGRKGGKGKDIHIHAVSELFSRV